MTAHPSDLAQFEKRIYRYIQTDVVLLGEFQTFLAQVRQSLARTEEGASQRQRLSDLERENQRTSKILDGVKTENHFVKKENEQLKLRLDEAVEGKLSQKMRTDKLERELQSLRRSVQLLSAAGLDAGAGGAGEAAADANAASERGRGSDDHLRRQLLRAVRGFSKLQMDKHMTESILKFHEAKSRALEREIARMNSNSAKFVSSMEDLETEARREVSRTRPRTSAGVSETGTGPSPLSEQTSAASATALALAVATGTPSAFRPITTQLPAACVQFLNMLIASKGENLFEHMQNTLFPEDQVLAVKVLGKEFFSWQRRSARLSTLLEKLLSVNKLERIDAVFRQLLTDIRTDLECDRATLWMVDEGRRVLWAKVRKMNEDTLMYLEIPMSGAGFVLDAYREGEVVNIEDAYQHPKFNRKIDLETGYHTKSVLCVPIKNQENRVAAVIQTINKLASPVFDEEDVYELQIWGNIASSVVKKTEKEAKKQWLIYRMNIVNEFAKAALSCQTQKDVVLLYEEVMHALFNCVEARLHLVYGDYSAVLKSDPYSLDVATVETPMLQGVVGHAVSIKAGVSAVSKGDGTYCHARFDKDVDIRVPIHKWAELHSYPFNEGLSVSIVIQFAFWQQAPVNASKLEKQFEELAGIRNRASAWDFSKVQRPPMSGLSGLLEGAFIPSDPDHQDVLHKLADILTALLKKFFPDIHDRRRKFKRMTAFAGNHILLFNRAARRFKARRASKLKHDQFWNNN